MQDNISMKLTRIDSTNARQPSWQILKEWEEVLSESTKLPIYKDSRLMRFIKSNLNNWGLTSLYKALFIRKNLGLRFIMNAQDIKVCDVNKYTIPVIVDFWLKEERLHDFYEAYKDVPLILVTNLEVYEFLKRNKCPIPVEHWALSYPDKYAMSERRLIKEYDFCFIGRPNPFFIRFLDKYCLTHPDFCYIRNNGNINNRQYIDNKGNVIAEDKGRDSYLYMIQKTKISCYTTPGIDESKIETSNFNQVTPRLFEMLCNQCHVIGHYPHSFDTVWYELDSIIPNVESYEEFEKWLDYYRVHDFDIKKGSIYMKKHYTSSRVKPLRDICKKYDIEIERDNRRIL